MNRGNKLSSYFIVLYIFALLVCSDMPLLGGYTISTILLPIMLCHVMLNYNKIHDKSIRSICRWYLLYIIWFLFAGLVNGDFIKMSGSISLVINYLNCILVGVLISFLINKPKLFENILNLLVCVIIFNIAITLFQFFNYEIGWSIWTILNPNINEIIEESMLQATQGDEQILGFNFCPGLFQSAVTNGYFMASFGLLPLVLASQKVFPLKRVLMYCTYLVSLITLLIIQQRAAFYIFLLLSVVIIFATRKSQKGFVFILFLAAIILSIAGEITFDLGRINETSLKDDSRYDLFSQAIDYISTNLMFGGRADFLVQTGKSAHNFILNALVYSGLLGTIILILIAGKMVLQSVRIILSDKLSKSYSLFFACALVSYISISLFHNESLATGTPVLFILYGLLIVSVNTNFQSK